MQPVTFYRRRGGQRVRVLEPGGGVFAALPAKGVTAPVVSLGPPGAKTLTPLFTCPVSAIPAAVRDLIELWWACRSVRALPEAGGFLDQPLIVQRAFPVFEREYQIVEREQQATVSASGATALLGAMFGGRRS